jgi:uncharacterized protein YbjT (DUF2867 family)
VLVTGATGGQGGAVARALLSRDWAVRAFVRDQGSPAAIALANLGAELVRGDLDDPATVRAAMAGVHGVFSVQAADFAEPHSGREVRQGVAVADAAAAAGVAHVVYSSVGGAERGTGIAHFETKAEVERHIRGIGLHATIVRPVFFMENFPYMLPEPDGSERVVPLALGADTHLQMIAIADIGRIVADAFDDPATYVGVEVEIAGDELTVREIAEQFTRADGVPTRFVRQPLAELEQESAEAARMFAWFDAQGYCADIAALRERHPGLHTLADWLAQRVRS